MIRLHSSGTVTDIALAGDFQYFREQDLLQRNIRELYDLPPDRPLSSFLSPLSPNPSAAETISFDTISFASRNQFESMDTVNQFFTRIPFSTLLIRTLEGVGMVGLIMFRRLPELASLFGATPFALIDTDGRLQGVNRAFLDRFPSLENDPGRCLNKPGDEYFHPNPMRWIAGEVADTVSFPEHPWKKVVEIDFPSSTRTDLKKFLDTERLNLESGKWFWSPALKLHGLLRFIPPLNTKQSDFKLELLLRVEKGGLPLIIVNGDRGEADLFPDYYGYLLGSGQHQNTFAIKKEGEYVHESEAAGPPLSGAVRIEITKKGPLFSYSLNGKRILQYRDPNPIDKSEGILYLWHRGKGMVELSSFKLWTKEKSSPLSEPPNETAFLNSDKTPFQFHQIYNRHLTLPGNRLLYGFLFVNIGRLRESLDSLKKIQARIANERDRYKALAMGADAPAFEFLGEAPLFSRLKSQAEVAAKSSATLLIEGETGSGKAVLARFIHQKSPFHGGPFVRVDCAALPETLIESELFGHEKGAFTGADRARAGKFEEADGGTLFLDEIGNLTLSVQAKLLNFLQDFTIERLGSNVKRRVKTRVIAAVNHSLEALVTEGKFRQDLFFRLNAIRFILPPLRERKEDIALLCAAILGRENERLGRSIRSISAAGYQKLMGYHWPGNIRELENVLQKAMLFCDQEIIGPEHLDLSTEIPKDGKPETAPPFPVGNSRALRREHLEILLERNNRIYRWAAREAGISEATLYRKLKKFGIKS